MLRILLCCALAMACVEKRERANEKATRPDSTSNVEAAVSQNEQLRRAEPIGEIDEAATITIRLAAGPRHLNPILAGDTVAVGITLGDVYEPLLLSPRPGARPTPHLAESVVASPDGRVWTFRLRDDIRFHDGTSLGVDDVIASFEAAKGAVGPLRGEFDDLLTVTAKEPDEVVLRFAEGRPGRRDAIAMVPIMPRVAFAGVEPAALHRASISRTPNGTGALRVAAFSGTRVELVRNENYWGTPSRAARIVYEVIPERERARRALLASTIDVLPALPVEEALRLVGSGTGLELIRTRMPAFTAAVFNTENPALTSETRRALSASIDRASIIRELYRGHGEVAVGPFVRHGPREGERSSGDAFVLEEAKARLAAALGNARSTFTVLVPEGSRTMARVADIWAADVSDVVEFELLHPDFGDMLARVRSGDFDIALLSFSTSADVDLYNQFHSTEIGRGNLSRLSDAAVDTLLESLRRVANEDELNRLSHELGDALVKLMPYAFLTTDVRLGVVRSRIGGIGETASGQGARFYARYQPIAEGAP